MTIPSFRRKILGWYGKHKRDLPWRNTRDPYKILVSEIMLQQTQVSRVLPKYEEFLKAFPDAEHLASAPEKQVFTVWSGLGYWRRARFLQETAQAVIENFGGAFPEKPSELMMLPGIGPYTAGAVACFAFGSDAAFIDTNIRRVYLHFFFQGKSGVKDSDILAIAQRAVWKKDPRIWHWALFDYGATQLRDKKINRRSRHYTQQGQFEGSFRSFRTRVMKKLLAAPGNKLSQGIVLDFLEEELREGERDWSADDIINALLADRLIKKSEKYFRL